MPEIEIDLSKVTDAASFWKGIELAVLMIERAAEIAPIRSSDGRVAASSHAILMGVADGLRAWVTANETHETAHLA